MEIYLPVHVLLLLGPAVRDVAFPATALALARSALRSAGIPAF